MLTHYFIERLQPTLWLAVSEQGDSIGWKYSLQQQVSNATALTEVFHYHSECARSRHWLKAFTFYNSKTSFRNLQKCFCPLLFNAFGTHSLSSIAKIAMDTVVEKSLKINSKSVKLHEVFDQLMRNSYIKSST